MKNFFLPCSPDFLEKETSFHGFEPLASCMSTTSYLTAPSVIYLNDISCEFKISVEISAIDIFKICNFKGDFFLLVALKNYISPHSAGCAEIFFYRILLIALKNFISPQSAGSAEFFFTAFCW